MGISVENKIFPHPVYLMPSLHGTPLELGNNGWTWETSMIGLPAQERSLMISLPVWIQYTMRKCSEEMQTLRAGCSKAEPQILAPPLTPSRVGQNLISCRLSLPLPTNPDWWGSMHAISSYHANRPTHTHTPTHKHTHTQTDRTDYDYNTLHHSLVCSVNMTDRQTPANSRYYTYTQHQCIMW